VEASRRVPIGRVRDPMQWRSPKEQQVSKVDILYALLFPGLFLSLWGLAWILDRVWPSNYERQQGHRGSERPRS
jgi:hypothetical protein